MYSYEKCTGWAIYAACKIDIPNTINVCLWSYDILFVLCYEMPNEIKFAYEDHLTCSRACPAKI